MEPFSHKRAQLATGEGPSSPYLKAGAFWPQKGKDYERLCSTSEVMIYACMIRLMLRRLTRR